MTANATSSLRDEPGCLSFDVLTEHGETSDRVVLYEIYENAAAFEAHRRMPHFEAFHAAADDLIEKRTLRLLDVAPDTA